MSSRPALLLWVSVKIQNGPGKRGFSFGLPVPLLLLCQWTDMAEDALTAARLFPRVRKKLEETPAFPAVGALRQVARELIRGGPTDFVDVDVENPNGQRVRVKCMLR